MIDDGPFVVLSRKIVERDQHNMINATSTNLLSFLACECEEPRWKKCADYLHKRKSESAAQQFSPASPLTVTARGGADAHDNT